MTRTALPTFAREDSSNNNSKNSANGISSAADETEAAQVGHRCTGRPPQQQEQQCDVHLQLHPSCCSGPHFRHSLSPQMIIRLSLLFLFTVGRPMPGGVTAAARSRRTLVPLGMDKQMFPPQIFDENAPTCTAEKEPCGFYSFSLDGKAPLKWIKSWCRCSTQHECVYERTDMRMRVYRQTCISHDDLLSNDDVGDEPPEDDTLQQQHSVMLVETVPSTPSADHESRDTVVEGDQQQQQQDDDVGHPQRTHRHHHHHRSNRHHHRHENAVTATNALRHSRKTHRQRQVIRRLRELVLDGH